MAHTGKTGLNYFPFDVDFFADEKIEFLSARFGLKGEAVAIRLLCKIYRNGYYFQWGDDEALLFAKRVGDGCQHSFVNDVVHELVKRGFLDESIFNRFSVLTSKGIQSRFIEASERRKKVDMISDFLLIDVEKMENVNILNENDGINPQSKVKKSKEKKNNKPPSPLPGGSSEKEPDFVDRVIQCFADKFLEIRGIEYYVSNNGAERSCVGKLLKLYKKKNPAVDSAQTLLELEDFFERCLYITDPWLNQNMSIPIVLSKMNQILNILRDGKTKQRSVASRGQAIDAIVDAVFESKQ